MNLAKFKDGLWLVECGSFRAGFIVSNGHLIRIAPCLRRNFEVFSRQAVWLLPPSRYVLEGSDPAPGRPRLCAPWYLPDLRELSEYQSSGAAAKNK